VNFGPGARSTLRRAARRALKAAFGFVLARPALSFFLRRQLYRFPTLANRLRAMAIRSRQRHSPPPPPDDAPLPDRAQHVLRDLQRAIDQARRSQAD
jgi:hypothetical protein